jgi:hypothetical protein
MNDDHQAGSGPLDVSGIVRNAVRVAVKEFIEQHGRPPTEAEVRALATLA